LDIKLWIRDGIFKQKVVHVRKIVNLWFPNRKMKCLSQWMWISYPFQKVWWKKH